MAAHLLGPDAPASRLTVDPTSSGLGRLHGAWWPRTRDPSLELPALLAALPAWFGVVTGIGLASAGWDAEPQGLLTAGPPLRLAWPRTAEAHSATLTNADHEHFELLVLPPRTPAPAAAIAMEVAADADNAAGPADVLTSALVRAERAAPTEPAAGHGGGGPPVTPVRSPDPR